MEKLTALIVPALVALSCAAAFLRGRDAYALMCGGARDGLDTLWAVFPPVLAVLVATEGMRACGLLDALTGVLEPVTRFLGIPRELAPLMLVRPLSGSAALALASELIYTHGPDSPVGRCAAVMLGSTETTFYVAAVYFGAAKIKRGRYAIPAALIADFTGFVCAALFARMLS